MLAKDFLDSLDEEYISTQTQLQSVSPMVCQMR